jgi:hypothetical protein
MSVQEDAALYLLTSVLVALGIQSVVAYGDCRIFD